MEVGPWLLFQFLLCFNALGVGALKDLDTREVSNWLFLVWGVLAFIGLILEYGLSVVLGVHLVFTVLISGAFYVLWTRYSAFIGGADVKAIMALSISLSALAIPAIAWAVLLAVGYMIAKTGRKKLKLGEMLALKAPFLPFLFVGFVITAATFAWG